MTPLYYSTPDEHLSSHRSLPYQKLAVIYDQVMRHVDYRHWAGYVASLIKKFRCPSPRILDIGCGTGELVHELAKLDLPCDGCDPSRDMLKIAGRKNPDHYFYIDHLPPLRQTRSNHYTVITCLYDTMNYLPSLDIFQESLIRIFTLLPPAGLLIFDLVSENFCLQYFDKVDEEEVIDKKYAYERRSYYIKARSEQVNDFTIYTPRGIYRETHVQKIYPYHTVESLIREQTSFELIGEFEDYSFNTAKPTSNRVHFVLRK